MITRIFTRVCLLGLALASLSVPSASADDGKQYYLTSTNSRDQKVQLDFAISPELLARQPDWSPTAT